MNEKDGQLWRTTEENIALLNRSAQQAEINSLKLQNATDRAMLANQEARRAQLLHLDDEDKIRELEKENAELRATLKEWVASQRGLMALAKALKEEIESCPNREHHKLADQKERFLIADDAAEKSYNSNDSEVATKTQIPRHSPTHPVAKERKSLRQQKIDIAKLVDEGRLYLVADHQPATWKEGFALWLEHAEAGNPQAQYNVGRCYHSGDGVESDLAKANEWYLKAAEKNDPRTFHNLYMLYQNEKFAQYDAAQSEDYLQKAVELEEPRAIKEAMRLQEKAAQEEAIRVEQERLARIEADKQQKLQDELRAFKEMKVAAVEIFEEIREIDTDSSQKIYSALFRLENISPGIELTIDGDFPVGTTAITCLDENQRVVLVIRNEDTPLDRQIEAFEFKSESYYLPEPVTIPGTDTIKKKKWWQR